MSLVTRGIEWFKSQFVSQEELYETPEIPHKEVDDSPAAGALPVRSIRPLEVMVVIPSSYSDARHAVDALAKGKVVIIVLNDSVDDETASRFVDFMSGAVYMAHGSAELLNDDVLICAPDTVRLDEDKLAYVSGIPTWKGPGK